MKSRIAGVQTFSVTLGVLSLALAASDPASASIRFGADGRDGMDGPDGRAGRDGQTVTTLADGHYQQFTLRGTDGDYGLAGMDGSDAVGCRQPYRPEDNVYGADGGDGGDAGRGGRGGNGGDATIYYTDLAQLRQIYIDATPGRGGRSGVAGRAGRGCVCTERRWVVNGKEYRCLDGRDGRPGDLGPGYQPDGRLGVATFIQSSGPLAGTQESAEVEIPALSTAQVLLSENLWSIRSGATALLAPGSVISDRYRFFEGRREYPVAFNWSARQPVEHFQGQSISVGISSGTLRLDVSEGMLYLAEAKMGPQGATVFEFTRAVLRSEADDLAGKAAGKSRDFMIELVDSAKVSDLVDTRVHLKFVADGFFNHTRFDDFVPQDLLTITDSAITIAVGKLTAIPDEDLESGKKLKAYLRITRALGSRQVEQEIELKHKIE